MGEAFSLSKMVLGLFTGTHWAKTVMFGLSAAFLLFVGVGVYRGYFKTPAPTTSQSAKTIVNHYRQPKVTFGCATVRTYEQYPTNTMRIE